MLVYPVLPPCSSAMLKSYPVGIGRAMTTVPGKPADGVIVFVYPILSAGSREVVVTKAVGVAAPTTIVPGALPDGEIVLVYGVAPAESDEVVTTKPDGMELPTKLVPDLSPDGWIMLVYPVAPAGSKEVADSNSEVVGMLGSGMDAAELPLSLSVGPSVGVCESLLVISKVLNERNIGRPTAFEFRLQSPWWQWLYRAAWAQ